MSRRTYPRFAAGLFAAALTAPLLLAQAPNPWRGHSTNPWRNAAAGVDAGCTEVPPACCEAKCRPAVAAAPMPRERHGLSEQEIRSEFFRPGMVSWRVVASDTPFPDRVARAATPAKLAGTWYRETPTMVVAFAVTGSEMKITLTTNTGEGIGTATITADCAVTKDGTVHGVFTGADVDVTGVKDARLGMELAELQLLLQELVDQPFAFRCRPADGGLMVSNVRLPGSDQAPRELMLCGKYKAASGPIPTPKPAPLINHLVADPNDLPATAYPPYPLAYPPAVYSGPVCVGMPPPVPMPATRYGPPPEVRDTMIRVFTEMMNGPAAGLPACPGPVCIPPATAYMPPYPAPYLPDDIAPTSYVTPLPPPPPPMPVPVAAPTRAGQLPVGTWYREVGPLRYKIDVKDGHFTVTLTMADKNDGEEASMDYILIAECYPTRTEGEVVGLITGFDIAASGKAFNLSEAGELLKTLPELQQALEGKLIGFSFRVYDDSLVIGKAKVPPIKGAGGEASAMFAAMGGRYTSSPKPTTAAKPKTGKQAVRWNNPPGEEYRQHVREYVPAVSSSPGEIGTPLIGPSAYPVPIGNDFDYSPPQVIGSAYGTSPPPMLPPAPVPLHSPVPAIPRSR